MREDTTIKIELEQVENLIEKDEVKELEGILLFIDELKPQHRMEPNILGVSPVRILDGYITTFTIKSFGEEKKFKYEGIILNDSLNHEVVLYLNDNHIKGILDKNLNRLYGTKE